MAKKSTTTETSPAATMPAEKSAQGVYSVLIPRCLLGERFILAESAAEALEKYKRPCGITKHREAARIALTDYDPARLPAGVTIYWG